MISASIMAQSSLMMATVGCENANKSIQLSQYPQNHGHVPKRMMGTFFSHPVGAER
jgi:hypothetical protein